MLLEEALKLKSVAILFDSYIKEYFSSKTRKISIDLLGSIPTDLDLFTNEFEDAVEGFSRENFTRKIFLHDFPDHIFSKTLINLIFRIFGD